MQEKQLGLEVHTLILINLQQDMEELYFPSIPKSSLKQLEIKFINKDIMLKSLILLVMISCHLRHEVFNNFEDLFKEISSNQIQIEKVTERLTPIYFEGASSDTTLFIEPSLPFLKFLKIEHENNKQDIIKINDTSFVLKVEIEGKEIKLDTDLLYSELYKLNIIGNDLFCILSKGTGLLKSGTLQEVTFFSLIDTSNVAVSSFVSWSNSIYAFDDINLDGKLDFHKTNRVKKDDLNTYYQIIDYSFDGKMYQTKKQGKYTKNYIKKDDKGKLSFTDTL